MTDVLPLYRFFQVLQKAGFTLGIRDYLQIVEAIYEGKCRTRREMLLLCQSQWAISRSEYLKLKELIRQFLPAEFTALNLAAQEDRFSGQYASLEVLDDADEMRSTERQKTFPPQQESPTKLPTNAAIPSKTQFPAIYDEPYDSTQVIEDELDLFYSKTYSDVGIEVASDVSHKYSAQTFAGQLPVPPRQIDQSWRRYRISRRIGSKTLLDIDATVEAISRSGSLLEPVLVAQHMNISRLILLVDTGGSMIPFKRAVNALIASAHQNNKAQVDTFYFHDVPHKFVYKTAALADDGAVLIDNLIRSAVNTGLLIISDGGAARGNIDEPRAEHTTQFIKALRRHIRFIAWLNPMPSERWIKSTAGMIAEHSAVPMYYYDRAGLEAAIALVRGASRFNL